MTTLKQTIIGILLSGWEFEEGSLAPEDMDHIIKIHNANNESAWQEVNIICPHLGGSLNYSDCNLSVGLCWNLPAFNQPLIASLAGLLVGEIICRPLKIHEGDL